MVSAAPKVTGQKKNAPKTSAEAKRKHEEAQKEIKQTEQEIKENDARVRTCLAELGKLDVEIIQTGKNISELKEKSSQLEKEINSLEASIKRNEESLGRLREEYLKAVKKMRATKKRMSSLSFIFSSKSFNEATRRMRYLKEFSLWRGRQTAEINKTISDLDRQKEELANVVTEQRKALVSLLRNEKMLDEQYDRQEQLVAELMQNKRQLETHLTRKKAEAKELGDMVSQLIAQEQRKAEEERRKRAEEAAKQEEAKKAEVARNREEAGYSGKSQASGNKGDYASARKRGSRNAEKGKKAESTGKEVKPSQVSVTSNDQGFEGMKGRLPKPTSTGKFVITSRFGRQKVADLQDVEYDNPGVDAETDAGASARAVYKGKVTGVYVLQGYNTVVIVNHGNYYTVYGGISSPFVKTGDDVEAGTNLGSLVMNEETPGKASIHFEVWKNRTKLDPEEWLMH